MKNRVLLYSLTVAMVVVLTSRAAERPGDQNPQRKPASFWMKKKLEYSDKILEDCHKHLRDGERR
jgi:hypothetical protein